MKLKKKNWDEITINDHKRIVEVYNKYIGDEENPMLPYDLVCAVYGKPWEWMSGLSIKEANEYVKTIEFLGSRPKPSMVKSSYVINGHKYKTTMNMQAVTTSQYIDFQNMSDKSGEMPAEFLAIILVPEGKEYNVGYDLKEAITDIEYHLPITDALGLTAFFFNLSQISMRRSLRRLKKMQKAAAKEGQMTTEQLEALQKTIQILESANGLRRLMP